MAWLGDEMLGVWVGAILTLVVYSYLLGDNPLYRLAEHIFVGTAFAYVAVLAYQQILRPQLFEPLVQSPADNRLLFIPLTLSLLLLLRALPQKHDLSRAIGKWGNVSLAYLFGVGAALAISGAILGTFIPQMKAAMVSLSFRQYPSDFIDNFILVIGTISVLLYFRFNTAAPFSNDEDNTTRASRVTERIVRYGAWLGRIMLMVTLGAVFASMMMSRVTLLIERVRFLLEVFSN